MRLTAAIIDLAADGTRYFEPFRRDDDPDTTLYRLTERRPDWLYQAVMHAHGTDRDGAPAMLPDDYRYAYARETLQTIADADPGDDADDLAEQFADETDAYTGQLLDWAHSHAGRLGYADEAAADLGDGSLGTAARLQLGQAAERREVFALVLADLNTAAGGDEYDPDDE